MDDLVTHHQAPFAGRYAIEEILGRGGMATVYKARDLRHDRTVALKLLHKELAASVVADRFAREIRMLATLHHPNILPLFDSGEHDGSVYYVVPCIEGHSLRARLERERQLPLEDALQITREVASALDHAHRQNIIHRDIKPENILLEDGHAVVADFGVARAVTKAADDIQTTAGMAVGTPAYMSPEQASADGTIDARTDQYSLACVLYEMLVGTPPLSGATPQATIARRLTEQPPSLRPDRDVSEELDRAIRRALCPVPADRFPDVATFAKALDAAAVRPSASPRRFAALGIPVAVLAAALLIYRPPDVRGVSLDPDLHVVMPFAAEGAEPAPEINGSAVARYLGRSIGYWRDVRLIDPLRVSDAVDRKGSPRSLSDALTVARGLGAGRLIWGDLWHRGDSVEIRAGLYDTEHGREIRRATVLLPAEFASATAVFDALGDSLALGSPRARTAAPAARGTRIRQAFQHYEAGHHAMTTWNLAVAAREFRRAYEIDPNFAQAALWAAQSMTWNAARPDTWRLLASRARTMRADLTAHEQWLVDGLAALAEQRYQDACDIYRRLLARDSLDFAAWHGLATCQARDPVVERDPRSPSGWRFRGSMHSALMAYLHAMEVLPSFHRAAAQLSPLPTELFPLEEASLRIGYAVVDRDTLRLAGVAGLVNDTLSFIPYPLREVVAPGSRAWPSSHMHAVTWTRERLRRVTDVWVRDFPASWVARAAHGVSLEAVGELARATAELQEARRLSAEPATHARLAHDQVRILVKRGEFAQARRLADSMVRARPEASDDEAHWLAGLAALTGKPHRTRQLLEARAGDPEFAFWYDGDRVRVPRPVAEAALALLAYASFPQYDDSARALMQRVNRLIETSVPASEQRRARAAVMNNPLTFGLWRIAPALVLELGDASDITALQRELIRGNLRQVRALGDTIRASRLTDSSLRVGDADLLYQQALVFLAAGDTVTATVVLDDVITGLPVGPRWLLEDVHRAAAIAPAFRLRSLLASRAGQREAAQRWARVSLELWRDADVPLRVYLRPLEALAGTPDE